MSFDVLARHYGWMECLLAGRKLQACRTAFLEEARDARSILLAGEGHGHFLAEVCSTNPNAQISCVDASSAMIDVARARAARNGFASERIQFYSVPILKFEPNGQFDLIVTQFFLDCFEADELVAVIDKLSSSLRPGGRWMVADFQIPKGGWQEIRARLVLALAYRFFRMTVGLSAKSLVDPRTHFVRNGLRRTHGIEFNFGLLYSEVWKKDYDSLPVLESHTESARLRFPV